MQPEQIGRFRIQSLLGRGAMGVVYRGHDPEIDRPVAIKLVRADLLEGEERESYLERFRNEAKIAGRCIHANIVSIYDFALVDGNPYLVMEYVDGVGLHQAVPRGTRMEMSEAVHIALQVLDALDYAHRFGIVHRDIKPANILLTRQARLKVTDFGISRFASTELTTTPLMIGTPSYMSPEQCAGELVDQRSDLFSLGCILYELLAGERPFAGISYTDTIFKLVNQPHTPLAVLRPDLPETLGAVIDKALAKKPEDRFDAAASFAHALRGIAPPGNAVPAAISGSLPTSFPMGDTVAAAASARQEPDPDADTLRLPLPGAGTAPARLELDDRLLDTISRRLALQVGPMAPIYLRQALRDARTPAMLCALLSKGIEDPLQRDRFVRDAEALLAPAGLPAPAATLAPVPAPVPVLAQTSAVPPQPVASPPLLEAASEPTATAVEPLALSELEAGSATDAFDPTATSRIPVEPRAAPSETAEAGLAVMPAAILVAVPSPMPTPLPPPVPVIPQTPPAPPVLTDGEIEHTLGALLQVIGPIARSVVRRAVVRARDRQALQILCEASVPREAERERFRALLRGPGGTTRGR